VATLWLHIGSHKTGTTATQKTLSGSRDGLREAGIVYPWNRLWFDEDPGTRPRGYAQHYLVEEAKRQALADKIDGIHAGFEGEEWLMSSELMSSASPEVVDHILDTFARTFTDIRAIMYVREPGALTVSRSATHIVMGKTTYEEVCDKPKVYRFKRNMTPWLERLGKDRFTVRVYDRKHLRNGHIVDDVLAAMGRDAADITLERATIGVTPSHNAVLAMSERNARGEGDQRGGWRSIPGPKFTLPADVISFVREKSVEDVAWLKEEFGIEFDQPADTAAAQ